jgi:hypothetical protein
MFSIERMKDFIRDFCLPLIQPTLAVIAKQRNFEAILATPVWSTIIPRKTRC